MTSRFTALLFTALFISACGSSPTIDDTERRHREQSRLLQQQTFRLAMHEEYLGQLAESQLELESALERIDERTQQIERLLAYVASPKSEPEIAEAPELVLERVDTTEPSRKITVGRNEWVWLDLLGRNLKARVDTGALSSSLNATDIEPFERDGRRWVRFRVPDEDHPEGGNFYEAPLVRNVRIRQASADGLERRPVVKLRVRMGDHVDEAEFNLTNRENMLYPLLLGRNFLRDVMVVDVSRKFTQRKYLPTDGENAR